MELCQYGCNQLYQNLHHNVMVRFAGCRSLYLTNYLVVRGERQGNEKHQVVRNKFGILRTLERLSLQK